MRDITEGELAKEMNKLEEMLEKEELPKELERIKEKAGITIPNWVCREMIKKMRCYETDDVQDIIEHYSTLSRTHYVPLSCAGWLGKQ